MTTPENAARARQETVGLVVYCPRCDSFVKTAVQVGTIGTHGCMSCGGQMEVYVAHNEVWEVMVKALVRRLFEGLASAWTGLDLTEDQRKKFFTQGMTSRERTALERLLPEPEAEWVRNAD